MGVLNYVRGVPFGLLWYLSVLISFYFLYCPLLFLMLINRKLYRYVLDVLFASWEYYPAAILCVMYRCQVFVSGDYLNPRERALFIMNHRTRLDWFYLWVIMLHGVSSTPRPYVGHRCKFVLKSPIRKIPAIGWILQVACFIYIHRKWELDKILMARSLQYYRDIDSASKILIFPEGTDLSPANKVKSDLFAQKNNMKAYDFVLHPRTTGFVYLAQKMRECSQLDAVYDLTVAYPKTLAQTEADILKGKIPQEIHFKIKRYNVSNLPQSDSGLQKWCYERWEEKEKLLRSFYTSKKPFPNTRPADFPWFGIYVASVTWTLFIIICIYGICTCLYVQLWVGLHTVIFILISAYTEGIQDFEIGLHNWLARRKK